MKTARILLFVAFAACVAPGTVAAGGYSCAVPRALLCDDCAREVVIALTPDGVCRVSFTPGDPGSGASRSLPLKFEVLTPPKPSRPWRARALWKASPASKSAAAPARCFAVNAHTYCE